MIEKKSGAINERIYDLTVYCSGESYCEIFLPHLVHVMRNICDLGVTTKQLSIKAYYNNYKHQVHHEFEAMKFCIECRQQVTEDDVMAHLLDCTGRDALSEAEQRTAKIRFPLCQFDDADGFARAIKCYIDYLNESIPQLMAEATKICDLKTEDFGFGYFDFKIYSD